MYYVNLRKTNLSRQIRLINVLAFCIIIITGSGCRNKTNSTKAVINSPEDVLVLNPGPDNPRNSEGDFITLNDGRILYIYTHYTGTSSDDHANAFLAGRYSSDKGKTWTQKDAKIVEQEGTMNVMSVSLLRLQNGDIALFYLRKNSTTDCQPMIRISKDEAMTWSEPVRCMTDKEGYFVLNNNRVIQLKNGRLLFAVALHQSPGEEKANSVGRLWSYFSDDNGATWKPGEEVANPENIVTQEPGLIELKNGDIMMFVRTMSGVQYFSYSKDKGETWSAVEPGNLKSPCSPASMSRIPSTGDLLVVWNDNRVNQNRTPLNIAISKDEGKTWINNRMLENDPKGSYCYTAIHFTGDDVLIGYFNWTTVGVTLKKINLDWIYNK
ncbi:MAG TPA: sialidase family protein [Bacteroidales bacterium]|nr:sialidase family protein [Bacteroidales bacterium]